MNNQFEIRDRRKSEWFWCDKKILKSNIFQTTKLVYFGLCTYSNEKTQLSYPSIDTLATTAGVSRRSTVNALNHLSKGGLIKIIKEKGKHNIYILLPVTSATIARVGVVQLTTKNQCNPRHVTSATDDKKTVPKRASEHTKEHTKRTGNLIEKIRQQHKFLRHVAQS